MLQSNSYKATEIALWFQRSEQGIYDKPNMVYVDYILGILVELMKEDNLLLYIAI